VLGAGVEQRRRGRQVLQTAHQPVQLGDLGHRLHLSAASVSSTWNNALLFALGIIGLVVLALQRPRTALLDAYLVALAVSFLVNDTPTDVAGYGGFAALGLWLLTRSEETRGRLQ